MNTAEFLSELHGLDIRLAVDGQGLRVNAPQGTLTASLREQISRRKAEILQFLQNASAVSRYAPPPIRPLPREQPMPLSFAQERLWFLEQLEPGSSVYNVCRASRLVGQLNLSALEASLNEIVRRHEVLRSAIRVVEARPVQIVQSVFQLKVSVTHLQHLADRECEQEISRRIQQAADTAFDFSSGRFLRSALLCLRNDEHILILTTHHIVSDAWSLAILMRELWSVYESYTAGNPFPLEDLKLQYADFAVWQRAWLQKDILESQVSYWKEQLKDLAHLTLPTDRPRPARQSFEAARIPITLPETLTTAIRELSNHTGVTPFMTLLAAFQILLYRYCGQEEIIVGSPIANRPCTELESLIGFFVNTLVLRSDLSGNPAFEEVLARVREVCLGAYAHQDLPFEKLVQELQPERNPSRNPLFQILFVMQNATRPFSGIPGLSIEPVERETTRSQFDLSLFLRERDGKYLGYFEYSTDLFDRETIERIGTNYRTLLEAAIANPNHPIATLPILTAAERYKILVEWNDTAADYPKDECIHQLFEEQVERTPDASAVGFEHQQITYRELNRRANQLAHYLISLGIGPEKLVGICVERSIEMVVGLLGILKAGGAYVPLDSAYPKERLRLMLQDAQLSVLLTMEILIPDGEWKAQDGAPQSYIFDPRLKVVCLDRARAVIEHQSSENPTIQINSHDLAYVIYTSGSTGEPKGVLISHRAVCNHLQWAQSAFPLDSQDRVLQKTSLSFDASVWEIFAPLINGACLILARPGGERDTTYLVRELAEKQITVLKAVPSLIRILLEGRIEGCIGLRHVLCGGEPLTLELQRHFYERSSATLHNLYGPTEATIDATCWTCRRDDLHQSVPIGRPIANTQVYVLDQFLQPLPVGVPGELHIGGASLARGYLNRPDLTGEKFISNPFLEEPNARLYKTGDIVRYLKDGNLEFLGRADNQIKIRGYRIELGEIENALNQHPSVKESAVVPRSRGSSGEKELLAHVVATQEPTPSVGELRRFLQEKLPDFMIPGLFVFLNGIPLMPNGKVDRNKLLPSEGQRPRLGSDFIEPRTEIEELVAQVWRKVLANNRIGLHDNFFELGGHSLLAVHIIAILQKTFDQFIPLQHLFDNPTIAGLAESVKEQIQVGSHLELPPITVVSRKQTLPLSLNQEQFWRLDQVIPGTHYFNIPYVYHLSGDLNLNALKNAVSEIVRRHEILRTVFVNLDRRPVQQIGEHTNPRITYLDLRYTGKNTVGQAAAGHILKERKKSFDLTRGPLFRIKLLRLTDEDYLLLITVHHVIADQWSMVLFRKELVALYNAFLFQHQPSPLSAPTVQFADYAVWERRVLKEGLFSGQLEFWKKQLGHGTSQLNLSGNERGTTELSFLTLRRHLKIDGRLFSDLKALAQRENCTSFIILMTALIVLLHLQTGQEDICVGILSANRGRDELANTIGNLTNTLILRTKLFGAMTLKDLVYRTKEVTIAAFVHQELPFEHLAKVLEQEYGSQRATLLQVMLIYQNSIVDLDPMLGLKFAPLRLEGIAMDPEVAITGSTLIFKFRETSTRLTGVLTFKPDIIAATKAEAMVGQFVKLIEFIVASSVDLSDTVGSIVQRCRRAA